MSEYVEKEAAIRNFCKGCGLFDTDNCICTSKVRCDEYDAIRDTPPASVTPIIRSTWGSAKSFSQGTEDVECNNCGEWFNSHELCGRLGDANFCPNCGVAMTEEAVRILAERRKGKR